MSQSEGVPVITTALAGDADRIDHDENGLLQQDPTDVDELRSLLLTALDSDRRARWSANAPASVADLTGRSSARGWNASSSMSSDTPHRNAGTPLRRTAASAALELGAGAVMLAAILVAPWMITPLRDADTARLELAMTLGIIVWAASVAIARRRPRVPAALIALVVAVLGWGALLTFNARARYDSATHALIGVTRPMAWLPGSVDRATSMHTLLQVATVLVATLVLIDIARWEESRPVALWAMATNGALLASIGAFGRLTHTTWFHHSSPQGGTPFAAFGSHGNAAAFLDLVLPAALVLVAISTSRRARLLALALTALVLVGNATQASKAGLAAAVAILLVFAFVMTRGRSELPTRNRTMLRLGALLLILIVGVAGAFISRNRWAELPNELSLHGDRADVWRVALDVWDGHRLTGSGPGSFKLVLPRVATDREPQLFENWIVSDYEPGHPVTIWMYADNDPLQTLAEWGAIGGLLLGAILLWPLARGFRRRAADAVDHTVRVGGFLALGVLYLHALIDFPLQVLGIQMTAGLWAAILIGGERTVPAARRDPRRKSR